LPMEEDSHWRVVCHKEPRNRRVNGTKLQFRLESHGAFEHPRAQVVQGIETSREYESVTMLETWAGEADQDHLPEETGQMPEASVA
jgi:hypothetical protein